MFESFIDFVKNLYSQKKVIALHEPYFCDEERKYLEEAIQSTYVSSIGPHIKLFEERIAKYTGIKHAIATVNGTSALHAALLALDINNEHEVLTQSLNFVAGCNAIKYCGASPVFIDIEKKTLGMDPQKLQDFLYENAELVNGKTINKMTSKEIRACIPMHTFGIPSQIDQISEICKEWGIYLIEDAAEALGSFRNEKHVGNFSDISILSFNGNKIITTGGGGIILTESDHHEEKIRHMTTTAKQNHEWEFYHDIVGYNYRMPNINAALGLGQLDNLGKKITSKKEIYLSYKEWSNENGSILFTHDEECQPNYWLNSLFLKNKEEKIKFLSITNENGVATRPAWTPMHFLPAFRSCQYTDLIETEKVYDCLVSIPSSPIAG